MLGAIIKSYRHAEQQTSDKSTKAQIKLTKEFWETAEKNLKKPPFNSKIIQAIASFQKRFVFVFVEQISVLRCDKMRFHIFLFQPRKFFVAFVQ